MDKGIWFWVIFVIALVFSGWSVWPNWRANAPSLVIFILLGILGWAVFGAVVK